jgi:hypothetical protein
MAVVYYISSHARITAVTFAMKKSFKIGKQIIVMYRMHSFLITLMRELILLQGFIAIVFAFLPISSIISYFIFIIVIL